MRGVPGTGRRLHFPKGDGGDQLNEPKALRAGDDPGDVGILLSGGLGPPGALLLALSAIDLLLLLFLLPSDFLLPLREGRTSDECHPRILPHR